MSSLHAALRAAVLVTQMVLQAIIGTLIGGALDGWLETSPVLVLALGGAGFTSGLLVTWRAFVQASDDDEPTDTSLD